MISKLHSTYPEDHFGINEREHVRSDLANQGEKTNVHTDFHFIMLRRKIMSSLCHIESSIYSLKWACENDFCSLYLTPIPSYFQTECRSLKLAA